MSLPPLALTYHGVAVVPRRRDYARLAVAPALLKRHIALLQRWGYRFTTASDLVKRGVAGEGAGLASLTFDDGFADNLHALVPILRETGVPTATVFVVSGWLGQPHPDAPWARLMSAGEVRELHRAGVEIGGHTMTHANLTKLDRQAATEELRGGRLALEELLDAPVTTTAYPYGYANDESRAAARDAGFESALRTEGRGNAGDPYDFPRQAMGNASTRIGLRLKRDGRYEALMSHRAVRGLRRAHLMLPR